MTRLTLIAAAATAALAMACGGSRNSGDDPAAAGAPADTAAAAEQAHADEAAPATPGLLAVGDPAPDFTGTLHDGSTVSLAALRGKSVVLYFYPKDFTGG